MPWQPIETAPKDRYVLLLDPSVPDWDGNMEVGKWFGNVDDGCWWSSGGPNGGLELECPFSHWMPLPPPPPELSRVKRPPAEGVEMNTETSPGGPVERIVRLQRIQATVFMLVMAATFGAAGSYYAIPGAYYAVLGFIVAGTVGAFVAFMVLLAAWIGRGAP